MQAVSHGAYLYSLSTGNRPITHRKYPNVPVYEVRKLTSEI